MNSTAMTVCSTGGGARRAAGGAAGQVEQVLGLYPERYFDLNVRHFHEKLAAEHGIGLSYNLGQAGAAGHGAGR